MKDNACFRVSADEVAKDFGKYAELAKSRAFEIYDRGKVEVMLVPIAAVQEWHCGLQVNVPAELISDEDMAAFEAESEWLKKWIEEHGDRWSDEE